MSKNYMPEVAKMLGVEIGEEFDLLEGDGEIAPYSPYRFKMCIRDRHKMLKMKYKSKKIH